MSGPASGAAVGSFTSGCLEYTADVIDGETPLPYAVEFWN